MFSGRSTIRDAKVESLSASASGLEQLVSAWPFKPHRWRRDGSEGAFDRIALDRLNHILTQPEVSAWGARCGDTLHGIAVLQRLEWDSRILEMSTGRLELIVNGAAHVGGSLVDPLLAHVLQEARRLQLRYVSVRVDAADFAAIHALERHGFLNVDVLLTFGAAARDLPMQAAPAGVVLRQASPVDKTSVGDIAATCMRHGRFHSDPAIVPEQARAVYRAWAAACCEGTAADVVIVAEMGERLVGFAACTRQRDTADTPSSATGTITLIASTQNARRCGVGSTLVAAAAEWFRSQEIDTVEVGTQLCNIAAARLYERCGFRLISGSLTFRIVIDP